MKKANLKIIFASIGCLSILSSGSGLVSCGTSKNKNDNPKTAAAALTVKKISPIAKSAILKKFQNQTLTTTSDNVIISNFSFTLGKINNTNKDLPSVILKGTFTYNKTAFKVTETINYSFTNKRYSVISTVVSKPATFITLPADSLLPVTDFFGNYSNGKTPTNTKLNAVINSNEMIAKYFVLYEYHQINKAVVATDHKTVSVNYEGHGCATSSDLSYQPFNFTITYNYKNKNYILSNYAASKSYYQELSHDAIAPTITKSIDKFLNGNPQTITNIKFNTFGIINPSINDQPFINVAGIYDFNGDTKSFSETIDYSYNNNQHQASNLKISNSITKPFLLNSANQNLKTLITKAITDKKYQTMSGLVLNSAITFANNDYHSNVISATFSGKCNNNPQDSSPATFSIVVNYDLKTQQYSLGKLIITPKFPYNLTWDYLKWAAEDSLKKLPNYNSKFKYSEQVINFAVNKVNIDPQTPNKVVINISGKF